MFSIRFEGHFRDVMEDGCLVIGYLGTNMTGKAAPVLYVCDCFGPCMYSLGRRYLVSGLDFNMPGYVGGMGQSIGTVGYVILFFFFFSSSSKSDYRSFFNPFRGNHSQCIHEYPGNVSRSASYRLFTPSSARAQFSFS